MTSLAFLLAQLIPVTIGAVAQLFAGRRREWIWLVAQLGFIGLNFYLHLYVFGVASVVYALLGVRNLVILYRHSTHTAS